MSVEPWIDACPRSAMMPPPGRPMLPEQQLEDRAGADHLHAGGVLRPADGVAERGRALAARVARSARRRPEEVLGRDAADPLDHLRRVAREVARAGCWKTQRGCCSVSSRLTSPVIMPAPVLLLERLRGVLALAGRRRRSRRPRTSTSCGRTRRSRGRSREKTPPRSSVSWKLLVDQRRGVRVVQDVLLEVRLGLDHVADQPAEERDVACPRGSARAGRPARSCARSAGRRG